MMYGSGRVMIEANPVLLGPAASTTLHRNSSHDERVSEQTNKQTIDRSIECNTHAPFITQTHTKNHETMSASTMYHMSAPKPSCSDSVVLRTLLLKKLSASSRPPEKGRSRWNDTTRKMVAQARSTL